MLRMEYICRRCGAHFGGHPAGRHWQEAEETLLTDPSLGIMPLVLMHECKDQDGCGLADLVGFANDHSLRDPDDVVMYAVAEKFNKPDSLGIGYHMMDGPRPSLKELMTNGLAGSNPDYRILELRDNEAKELYWWNHGAGSWVAFSGDV